MAVYPNTQCYFLCEWMLTVFSPRLTGPQQTLTATIQAAALSATSVTDQEWKDFNNFAQWRNPYYIVYRDYQTFSFPDLLTGLLHYYNFEGNSNDQVGSVNGTDTGVVYNTAYGKIGQGVRNNNSSSSIVFGVASDFNWIHNTLIFSINFWVRYPSLTSAIQTIGSTTNFSQKGFCFNHAGVIYELLNLPDGSANPYGTIYTILYRIINNTNYNMITICGDATYFYVYVNAVLVYKGYAGTTISGNATNAMAIYRFSGTGSPASVDFDELGFWNRCLSLIEVNQLYNNGAGITYPF